MSDGAFIMSQEAYEQAQRNIQQTLGQSQTYSVPVRADGKPIVNPLVGIPLGRDTIADAMIFHCFLDIAAQGWSRLKTDSNATDMQRNIFAEEIRKAPEFITDLVMLDADHRHGPNTVKQLVQDRLEHPEIGVIVGLNFRRREPFDPCVWIERDGEKFQPVEWEQGLIGPLYRTGLASVIIARWVFEKVPAPWFANTYTLDTEGKIVYKREDFYFSDKCRKHGVEMWCDTRVISPHTPNLQNWVDSKWWKSFLQAHPDVVKERVVE